MIVSLQNVPKNYKMCEKWNWKYEYRLNHSTNFSVWFTTTFYECFLIVERIYDDRIPPKCPKQLRKFAKNLKMRISHFYKLFSVVQNYFLCIFQIVYGDCILPACSSKNLEKLQKRETWKFENRVNHATNLAVWFITIFYVYFKLSRECMMILSSKIYPNNFQLNWISTKHNYMLNSVQFFLSMAQIIVKLC